MGRLRFRAGGGKSGVQRPGALQGRPVVRLSIHPKSLGETPRLVLQFIVIHSEFSTGYLLENECPCDASKTFCRNDLETFEPSTKEMECQRGILIQRKKRQKNTTTPTLAWPGRNQSCVPLEIAAIHCSNPMLVVDARGTHPVVNVENTVHPMSATTQT